MPRTQPAGQLDARGKLRTDYQTSFKGQKSKTVQSDAHLADIQEIMKKFGVVGMAEHLQLTDDQFQDVTEFTDYADVMNHVKEAESTFLQLPSKVRELFDHDVAKWLDAAHDGPPPVAPGASASAAAPAAAAVADGAGVDPPVVDPPAE